MRFGYGRGEAGQADALHEADAAHAPHAPLNDIIASAPADVQAIFDDAVAAFRGPAHEQQALLIACSGQRGPPFTRR